MVLVDRLRLRAFRSYERAELELGPAVTVISGENGAGKTNLLEALYFGCTGRSCRTSSEREVVRFGAPAARVEVDVRSTAAPAGSAGSTAGSTHTLAAGFAAGEPKRLSVDGISVDRLLDHPARPLMSVFLPERLELVKGGPSGRRAHMDQFVAGIWPARALHRREYGRALAQRNALLARVREGLAGEQALDAWDRELARWAVPLSADRSEAVALLADVVPAIAEELGLVGGLLVRHRGRDVGNAVDDVVARLREQRGSDLQRGFTQSGPHRDDLVLMRDERELRVFGSQGQQRLGLLALQLAEREVLTAERAAPPVLLLDDVMSELDADRRRRLVERVATGGQALITATEIEHVPRPARSAVHHVGVADGIIRGEMELAA